MQELGTGFLESVYKKALVVALEEKGAFVEVESAFDVYFRGQNIGLYKADLVLNHTVIIQLKSCKCLLPEHQAQVINYLKATNLPVGLLVNFGNRKLEYKRLHHPIIHPSASGDPTNPIRINLRNTNFSIIC